MIEKKEALFIGGNFWDGRASGEKLGNPAADQAQGPFVNPLEQALPVPADVVSRVCGGSYRALFTQVWGNHICEPNSASDAYDKIALSIAAFEASPESNAFTSKYDYYLKGMVDLTNEEKRGLNLFKSKGRCAKCHVLDSGHNGNPLLTDFTYDNLGVPRNPGNPFYGQANFNRLGDRWIDLGLENSWRAVEITSRLHQRTMASRRSRRCAMSTSDPMRDSPRPTHITVISRA